MAVIKLTQGLSALVDDCDIELLAPFTWGAVAVGKRNDGQKRFYVAAFNKGAKGRVYMHRLILGAQEGQYVDHINGDALDNRRANLRFCTAVQNNGNTRWKVGESGYRGVAFDKRRGKFFARISMKSREFRLGTFTDPVEAARRYDEAAREYFGEFATVNFPSEA